VDVPAVALAELPNENSIAESVEVDVVVVRGRDDKFVGFDVLLLDDLDGIDDGPVGNDEVLLDELGLSGLVI
jgi:hypothetical protein